MAYLPKYNKEQREKIALAQKEFAEQNKKYGEAFLAANKAKDGAVVLPSGLHSKVLGEGAGKNQGRDANVGGSYRGILREGSDVGS